MSHIITIWNDFEGVVKTQHFTSVKSLSGGSGEEVEDDLTMDGDEALWDVSHSTIALKATESSEKAGACKHGREEKGSEGCGGPLSLRFLEVGEEAHFFLIPWMRCGYVNIDVEEILLTALKREE